MQHRYIKILIFITGVLISIGIGFFVWQTGMVSNFFVATSDSPDAYAKRLVATCADSGYRPTCYEEEIPKLVTELSSVEIFDVIRAIRKYDPEYLFCHVAAHQLGEYEVSLDPDNWLDVIAKGPTDGLCSNGFAHGAIVTRFNDGDLSPEEFEYALTELAVACETREGWNPTELIKAICYHGIGHVLIHMTEAKVDTSLEACETIALKDDGRDYRNLCIEGVYMQLFQPLEPEDYALVDQLEEAPTRDNIEEFCATESNNDNQYGACWREAWPLFYGQLFTAEGVTAYCSALDESQNQEKCFTSAFTINGRHHLGNPEAMASLCNSVPEQYQGMCFARGANAFPEENQELIPQAINMCSRAESEEAKDECYNFLANVASFNFHPGSDAFEQMCSLLPQQYELQCRG